MRRFATMTFSTTQPCNIVVTLLQIVRDLSEISGGGGRVETEGGSQLFETQKREGS